MTILPNDSILTILNNLNNDSIHKELKLSYSLNNRYIHPSRYPILFLYLSSKKFEWLKNILITAVEDCKEYTGYSTFDIFGNNTGISFSLERCAMWSVEGISSVFYENKNNYIIMGPFGCYGAPILIEIITLLIMPKD